MGVRCVSERTKQCLQGVQPALQDGWKHRCLRWSGATGEQVLGEAVGASCGHLMSGMLVGSVSEDAEWAVGQTGQWFKRNFVQTSSSL